MSRQDKIKDIKQLLYIHIRYLQKAREVQALYGGVTPPHFLIEIEDREAAIERLRRQLEEIENTSDEEFEEFKELKTVSSHQVSSYQKTAIRTKSTGDEQVSLKEMLTKLILDYLIETDDIEVSFDPTQKIYRVILSKMLSESKELNEQIK